MKKKILVIIIGTLLLLAGIAAWMLLGPAVKVNKQSYLYIKTGASIEDVQNELKKNNFLSSATRFKMAAKLVGYKNIKPGKYKLVDGMSVVSLVRMLNNGKQWPVSFVVTKFRTKEILAKRISAAFECDSADVMNFLNSPDSLKPFDLDTNTVMAAVMPLTYEIKWNTTPGRIFRNFYTSWKAFWTDERKQKAEKHGLTPIEASTVASIVDEETNAASDKPNMASVYLNRKTQGWPLQADPTLKFAIKNFELKRIYDYHKKTVSPYNTYMFKGLPPGPICTPALETIDAVLDSPKTDYMFFVANSDFSGTHIFTSNLDDHNKYARLFQKEQDRRGIK